MEIETLEAAATAPAAPARSEAAPYFPILWAISLAHLLNDTCQALIPALYPVIKQSLALDYKKVGAITFTFQCTAAILQPVVGVLTDRRSMPYSLAVGMGFTMMGMLYLARADSYALTILAAALVGLGSAVFHPEASRVAHMAAGRSRGLAQSLFQVGGNAGSALGAGAAQLISRFGQAFVGWFAVPAGLGVMLLARVGFWQSRNMHRVERKPARAKMESAPALPRGRVAGALLVLLTLIFSKYVYLVSLTSYYTFYLIARFQVSVITSQRCLFAFLVAVAAGTIIGGPVGDRIGRKSVIWVSILGVAPFTLWLPHAGLALTVVLSIVIGLVLASAFSAILVYAQELMPGKVGLVAGLFFGLAFGIAGIGAEELGVLADRIGILSVFHYCAYLPLIGLLTVLLPDVEPARRRPDHG